MKRTKKPKNPVNTNVRKVNSTTLLTWSEVGVETLRIAKSKREDKLIEAIGCLAINLAEKVEVLKKTFDASTNNKFVSNPESDQIKQEKLENEKEFSRLGKKFWKS